MSQFLSIDQLRIGIYVLLDLQWVEHPFAFSAFRIKSQDQIDTLRQLGLERVRYDPARSVAKPLPLDERVSVPEAIAPATESVDQSPMMEAKRLRIERLRRFRETVAHTERALENAVRTVREIDSTIANRPREVLPQAEDFIRDLASAFLGTPDATIHAMGGRSDSEDLHQHGLNVALLSLIMAKAIDMPEEQSRILGMGALFHDIGLREIPSRILRKTEPLTEIEFRLRQMHCEYGVELGKRIGFAAPVLRIIQQHHEMMDGTGYPARLKDDQIDTLARIVEIANRFDVLCNPVDARKSMSPHAALSWMFSHQRSKHDPALLRVLIRCLGIYPPGTAVHISNGATALVASINPQRPLRPTLVVYDPDIPKDEAIVLDLEHETDINISNPLDPNELPRVIRDYLSMRQHVSYYFDEGPRGGI